MSNVSVASNAVIEQDVAIGDGTSVWYFSHIRERAKIGLNCNIGDYVFVDEGVIIGNDTRIGNHVSLYKGIIIKDRVFVGNNATFINARYPSVSKKKKIFLTTVVNDDAYIGAGAVIGAGVEIGQGAHIAEGATVILDVPSYSFVGGNIAKIKTNISEKYARIKQNN